MLFFYNKDFAVYFEKVNLSVKLFNKEFYI